MEIRIKGLVSAFNDVRAQIQAGIGEGQEKRFRSHVQALLARVEKICAAQGATPDSLPSPSRRAYVFLKGLDTRELSSLSADGKVTGLPRLRVANVVKSAGAFSKRMWDDLPRLLDTEGDSYGLASDMLDCVSGIESACSRRGGTPALLEAPSRRAYGWLRFLSNGENFLLHLSALNIARSAISNLNPKSVRIEVHMTNMNSIWRRRTRGELIVLKVNEGFARADEGVWQGLINSALKTRGSIDRGIVNEYVDSEEFSGTLFEMESFTEMKPSSSGLVHNLDDSFDRVNVAYFEGSLARPRLRWNHVLTTRTFGHYEFARDIAMLSVSLDDAAVPERLVDYVMYHELLHKRHGVKLKNGRRMVHTSAFRADERKFKGYEEAVACLNSLARRLRSR